MGPHSWMQLIDEHRNKNCGMFAVVGRVFSYSAALFFIMTVSDRVFGDTYTANLSLFTLFSFVFELLCAHAHKGLRFWCYVLCVVGIALSGSWLIHQAMHVQAAAAANTILGGK